MPRELKKRGRRAQAAKRKRDDVAQSHVTPPKKVRLSHSHHQDDYDVQDTVEEGLHDYDHVDHGTDPVDKDTTDGPTFYGLLDDDEQEYFKRADGMLEVNQFPTSQDRDLFVANVHKEAEGKELKLACSQSCSRLLERLIRLSTPEQLKNLFDKFAGQFSTLVRHRFASHCCETLFAQAAPFVTQDYLAGSKHDNDNEHDDTVTSATSETIGEMYLLTISELEGDLGYLMTDKFGSHALRILLLILSGEPLDTASHKSILRSRRKENIDVSGTEKSTEPTLETRTVPASFKTAFKKLTSDSLAGLDSDYIRALATHNTANPILQLFIHLETKHLGKQHAKSEDSIIRRLLPDDPLVQGTASASFLTGLVFDPVGSRLVEAIVQNAPGKMFKSMYNQIFRERLSSLARNEIAGYVVCKMLERLSAEDLSAATASIIPQIPNLASRGRTSVIKALIERCSVRGVDTQPLATALQEAYPTDADEDHIDATHPAEEPLPGLSLIKLLDLPKHIPETSASITATSSKTDPPPNPPTATPQRSHRHHHQTSLATALLTTPGPLTNLLTTSLLALPQPHILHIALTPPLSPLLQTFLTHPATTPLHRRKLITRLYGHFAALSVHPSASHVVDAVERGTRSGLAFARERVAEELAESESLLRGSPTGRKVWRNWRMDLYKTRRGVWVRETRREVGNRGGFVSFPSGDDGGWGGAGNRGGDRDDDDGGGGGGGAGSFERVREAFRAGAARSQTQTQTQQSRPHGRENSKDMAREKDGGPAPPAGKSALQLARERYARSHPGRLGRGG